VRKAAANKPPGTWIRGRAWDQTNWGGQFPDASVLTEAAPIIRFISPAWMGTPAGQTAKLWKLPASPKRLRTRREERFFATRQAIHRVCWWTGRKPW
jgi:Predicted metal-dependent hydrolase with the TIM-barrel fold